LPLRATLADLVAQTTPRWDSDSVRREPGVLELGPRRLLVGDSDSALQYRQGRIGTIGMSPVEQTLATAPALEPARGGARDVAMAQLLDDNDQALAAWPLDVGA
jgi:hypothetical protein